MAWLSLGDVCYFLQSECICQSDRKLHGPDLETMEFSSSLLPSTKTTEIQLFKLGINTENINSPLWTNHCFSMPQNTVKLFKLPFSVLPGGRVTCWLRCYPDLSVCTEISFMTHLVLSPSVPHRMRCFKGKDSMDKRTGEAYTQAENDSKKSHSKEHGFCLILHLYKTY